MSDDAIIIPTPERFRRGYGAARVAKAIADEQGRPAQPYRSIDILASMEKRKSISPEQRQAGEQFRMWFARAQLEPLRAADVSRPIVSGRKRSLPAGRVEDARSEVAEAIGAVGGLTSIGGSCLWHVIGLERTLKEWAIEQGWADRRRRQSESLGKRGMPQETASGVLICALGTLQRHYGL